MKKFLFNLKLCVIALGLCFVCTSNANAVEKTGTIKFGTKDAKIDGKSVTVQDKIDGKEGNEWSISTVGTTSFTQNQEYSQIGSGSKPATSITFTTTLPSNSNIKAFSASFGGFSKTAGNITLYVDETKVGSGTLNATEDVTVESGKAATGKTLTIKVTGIAKGVKVYEINYTYDDAGSGQPVKELSSISVSGTPAKFWLKDAFNHTGMSVTATYSDKSSEDVTEDAEFSTPDMKSAGEKEVNVSYGGKTTSYKIKVQTIANTKETAYTTAEAKTLIDAGKDLATSVYVKGVVSKVDKYTANNKTLTYWLDENTFEVYNGKNTAAGGFASVDDVKVGANVIVYGTITYYEKGKVYEFNSSSELVEYNGAEPVVTNVAPSFTTQPVASKSYKMGDTAKNLTIAVAGTPEPTLQWYVNTANTTEGGVAIDGATSTTYKPSIKELGTKYYYCVATNSEGSVASSISTISVKAESKITLNGYQTKLFLGDEDTYTVETIGDGVLSVISKDANVATATLKGNKVIIKTDKNVGSTDIIFNLDETDKYSKAQPKSYTLNVVKVTPASLDFTFNDGRDDIKESEGTTHNGLGTDYKDDDTKLKFDGTGDYLIIAFSDEPGELSYSIKNNSFSGGQFDVMESADNKTYTIAKSHKEITGTDKVSVALKSSSRFVKFVYTSKSSGNVGLGNIKITKAAPEIATEPTTTATEGETAWTEGSYSRTVATGMLSTICLPYDAAVEGAELFVLKGKEVENKTVKSLCFELTEETAEESNVLKAGVPYLYKATADKQTFTKTGNKASEVTPLANAEGFRGTYSEFMLPVGSYFLYNGGKQEFRKSGDSGNGKTYVKIGAFKCYITAIDEIDEVQDNLPHEASRRIYVGTFIDETTGIATLNTDNIKSADGKRIEDGRVIIIKNNIKYNINGQRIK